MAGQYTGRPPDSRTGHSGLPLAAGLDRGFVSTVSLSLDFRARATVPGQALVKPPIENPGLWMRDAARAASDRLQKRKR